MVSDPKPTLTSREEDINAAVHAFSSPSGVEVKLGPSLTQRLVTWSRDYLGDAERVPDVLAAIGAAFLEDRVLQEKALALLGEWPTK